MTLAVVILNWNQAADTIACVRTLITLSISPEHIWVVDNASAAEDVEQIQRDCCGIQLICSERNRGFAGGNNLALRSILRQEYGEVLLLNNDAILDARTLDRLRRTLQAHREIGIVGPVMWDAAQPDRLLAAGGRDIAHHISSHIRGPISETEMRDVDYVPGTCVLIRTEVLRVCGLLDEDYFFGGEVASLCKTAVNKGYRCVVDYGAHVLHTVQRSSQIRRVLHVYYVIRNRFLFVRRYYPREKLPLFLFWTGYAIYIWSLALLSRDWQRARAIGLGCIDGWRGRFGGQNLRVTNGHLA